jgi:hypothetical protein
MISGSTHRKHVGLWQRKLSLYGQFATSELRARTVHDSCFGARPVVTIDVVQPRWTCRKDGQYYALPLWVEGFSIGASERITIPQLRNYYAINGIIAGLRGIP